jgi:hypothetical protein
MNSINDTTVGHEQVSSRSVGNIWYTTSRTSSTPGWMGSSLYASSTRPERLQIAFGLVSQATQAGDRIYDSSSGLKGLGRFTSPAVFDFSRPFQYTCSSRPASMIQGTGLAPVLGRRAVASFATRDALLSIRPSSLAASLLQKR